jgi:8-oxo-dGTP pyrophosphatase MutT (NUDIX family)
MDLPKILVSGKFNPDDLEVSMGESTRKIDPAVESKIEGLWTEKLKRAQENGQNCYNGISYRLNALQEKEGKLVLNFGTLEYKVRDGLIAIPEYFELPEEYYRKGCFSCASIRTSDGRYLMAELSGKSMNPNTLEFIGGIMETDIPMNSGHDIFENLYKEAEEEAGIRKEDVAEVYLQAVYLEQRTNIGFYFEMTLSVSSGELLERFSGNKDTDIKLLVMFTREEYLDALTNHKSLNKRLTAQLLQI